MSVWLTGRCLCCKPTYCKEMNSCLSQANLIFKMLRLYRKSNLFYSGKFLLCSNFLLFSDIQNLKHMMCTGEKDVRCNEEENSVLW